MSQQRFINKNEKKISLLMSALPIKKAIIFMLEINEQLNYNRFQQTS